MAGAYRPTNNIIEQHRFLFCVCDLIARMVARFRSSSIKRLLILISMTLVLWCCFGVVVQNVSLPKNSCVVTEYIQPPKEEVHPECFLQRYCLNYEIQPVDICGNNIHVRLFIFIYSLPANFQRRQMIRKTWLDRSLFGGQATQHVFLLGHGNASYTDMVQQEARTYNDIVVIDLEETFCSLTLKGIAGLHFASSFCPSAKFVMKTDDDIFINMFLLQRNLSVMVEKKQTEKIIMGFIWFGGEVFRSGQYEVSALQYAGSTYPPFCSGSAFIMSMDVVKVLYELAMQDQSKVLLHLDDPYITGVLADRAKLKHIQLNEYYLFFRSDYTNFPDKDLNKYLILHIHDKHIVELSSKQHLDMWHRLVKLQKKN